MIYRVLLFLGLASALVIQEFLPAVGFGGGQVPFLLLPTVFLCAAVTTDYASMLGLAAAGGLLWDLRYGNGLALGPPEAAGFPLNFADGEAQWIPGLGAGAGGDLFLGSSVLFFAAAGSLMFGVSPLARQRRWVLPVLMVGACLLVIQVLQFLLLNLLRGGFDFPVERFRQMTVAAAAGMLASPLIFALLYAVAKAARNREAFEPLADER